MNSLKIHVMKKQVSFVEIMAGFDQADSNFKNHSTSNSPTVLFSENSKDVQTQYHSDFEKSIESTNDENMITSLLLSDKPSSTKSSVFQNLSIDENDYSLDSSKNKFEQTLINYLSAFNEKFLNYQFVEDFNVFICENKMKPEAFDVFYPPIFECLKRLDDRGKLTLLALISPFLDAKGFQAGLLKVDGFFDYLLELTGSESNELKDFVFLFLKGLIENTETSTILECLKRFDEKGKLTILALISPSLNFMNYQTNILEDNGFLNYMVDLLHCDSSELKDYALLILQGFIVGKVDKPSAIETYLVKNDRLIDSLLHLLVPETNDAICEKSLVILASLATKDEVLLQINDFNAIHVNFNDMLTRDNVEIKKNISKILSYLSINNDSAKKTSFNVNYLNTEDLPV